MPDAHPPFEAAAAALTRYFVGNQTLGDSLHEVGQLTMQALPQTNHVGITLLVDGKLRTSVFASQAAFLLANAQADWARDRSARTSNRPWHHERRSSKRRASS